MPGWVGPGDLLVLLLVVLVVFGPKRLPEIGRNLGKGMRDFKAALTDEPNDGGGSSGATASGPDATGETRSETGGDRSSERSSSRRLD